MTLQELEKEMRELEKQAKLEDKKTDPFYIKIAKQNRSFYLEAGKEYFLLKKRFLKYPNPKNEKEIDEFWNKYFEEKFQYYFKK